jgi:alpha-1,3-rhamnosyl/mannosyltransferase
LRIAFDGRFLTARYPGIGRYAFNLLRALPRAAPEAEVTVLVGEEDPRFPWRDLAESERLPVSVPVRNLAEQLVLPRALRRLDASVFHSPYFVTAYRPPCPLVVTVHDAIGASRDYLPSPFARLAVRVGTHLALRAARAVITVSEASKRELVRRFGAPAAGAVVIPEAAAPELRPATDDAKAELRRRRNLPERYALFVGTAKPHKNLEGLIRAWSELGGEACSLVVAGRRDPRFPGPERTARSLGVDVRFLGEVPEAELPVLYSGAELVAVPSFCEGFGLPVVEAMACGTPVACSGVSSLPEVTGGAAALFDPASTASMAKTVTRLLREPELRRELAGKGLRRARTFSWATTAELTFEVYRQTLLEYAGL